MSKKKLSRREFLQMGGLAAAGAMIAACAPSGTANPTAAPATAASATSAPTTAAAGTPVETLAPTAAAAANEVILDVVHDEPAYQNLREQIFAVFTSKNPGVKFNLIPVHEPTIGEFNAKIAGGWLPHIEMTGFWIRAGKDNYQNFIDLSQIGFPYFDNWTWDIKNTWSKAFNLPGPRVLDSFQGFLFTWLYRQEHMDAAGLDPRKDVKTQDDLYKWLDAGTQWAKKTQGIEYFWDVGWHNENFSLRFPDVFPMAYPDGQRQAQADCWMGKAKFNAKDSPYRYAFDFMKDVYDKGYIPKDWFTRQFQEEHQAAIIAGKSVAALHGPWLWEKAKAADPNVQMNGFPAIQPAKGQDTLVQYEFTPPGFVDGWFMRAGNDKRPEWDKTKAAYFWRFSPEGVGLFAEGEGRGVLYKMDRPLNIKGGQYESVVKELAPGGMFANVKQETGIEGFDLAAPYLIKGGKTAWDWESNNNQKIWQNVMTNKMTTQEALDWLQKNWDESYKGLPS